MENNNQQAAEPLYPGFSFQLLLQQQQQQQQQMLKLQHLEEKMRVFWNCQREEIEELDDFKHHQFPISRIKRIMKTDKNVLKVSAETPILFAKACELFIVELTLRSWFHAEENKRGTLKKSDCAAAIRRTEIFDFLADFVPGDEINEVSAGFGPGMVGPTATGGIPNFYPPMGQPAMPGVMIGGPAMPGVMIGGPAMPGVMIGGPAMPGVMIGGPAMPGVMIGGPAMPGVVVGGPAMPGVMVGGPAMPGVAPSVYVQPPLQAWQPAGDNSNAGGWNGGQGNFGPQS